MVEKNNNLEDQLRLILDSLALCTNDLSSGKAPPREQDEGPPPPPVPRDWPQTVQISESSSSKSIILITALLCPININITCKIHLYLI